MLAKEPPDHMEGRGRALFQPACSLFCTSAPACGDDSHGLVQGPRGGPGGGGAERKSSPELMCIHTGCGCICNEARRIYSPTLTLVSNTYRKI